MRVAAAAYPLTPFQSWAEYGAKLEHWVADAAGADLLVFPEYGAMELAAISGAAGGLEASLKAVDALVPQVDALHAQLAEKYGAHILAASAPVFMGERPVNRARLFAPNGTMAAQDKQIMTRFERETWDVAPGDPLRIIDTVLGKIGVLICYDAEFPLLARALVSAGADILLVPSCTDTRHGWNRVRIGAAARALENQCVAIQAVTVGESQWCAGVDENHGAACVFGPPDAGFPEDGVIAMSTMDQPGWTFAEIDPGAIAHVRTQGAQHNLAHWDEQPPGDAALHHVTLR
ncbi:MAG: carbon-nitrogen hydrolase family protein [Pseudomonadota bacterium]